MWDTILRDLMIVECFIPEKLRYCATVFAKVGMVLLRPMFCPSFQQLDRVIQDRLYHFKALAHGFG
ncbi:MAG: hypothetical protein QOH42_2027 [Blastocatellia bacterium]|jgi:hypothetical protein|nr:hypothetical protein [Blastocatellia bacterium]